MKAKLIIKDEVNCKIEGLSLADRNTLVKKFKYEVPGAKYQPSVRLGRWDGKVGFFSVGAQTYINLLPDIIPYLDEHGYEIEVEDKRDYRTTFDFTEITQNSYSHINWPKGHPKEGQPMELRDYQPEIINRFFQNPQCVQEIATGAGKCLAGDTVVRFDFDETTPFGQFVINKLRLEKENDVTRNNKKI